eukprot:3196084-Pyramimonas_sp.AAC.1
MSTLEVTLYAAGGDAVRGWSAGRDGGEGRGARKGPAVTKRASKFRTERASHLLERGRRRCRDIGYVM